MLTSTLLHLALDRAGIPVLRVTQHEDGRITATYAEDATDEQKLAGANLVASFNPDLEARRQQKRNELQAWWDGKQSLGIQPQGKSFRLGLAADDVALLNGQYTLAKTAVELGVKLPTDTFIVMATDSSVHQFTLVELTQLLLDYGSQRTECAAQYLSYQALIEQAASIAELDAVSLE